MNWLIVLETGCPERKATTHFAEKRHIFVAFFYL